MSQPVRATDDLRCLAGVDEAGLGPILGPLVVAGATMTGPRGVDPWAALAAVVRRQRPGARQIQVADSKKVKLGVGGLARLERTALAAWAAWDGAPPPTLAALLARQGVDVAALRAAPWYADVDLPLPLANDPGEIELLGHLLARELDRTGLGLPDLAVRPLEVAEYNRSILRTDNKSVTHFTCYAEVIGRLCAELPGDAHLLADRAGGRRHYRDPLRRALPPGHRVAVLHESAELSRYALTRDDGATIRLTFASDGEERAFPTALASCLAKYVRECFMTVLNRWFQARIPGLRQTAGYYVDGVRFLADVEDLVARERLPRESLRRSR